MGLLTHGTFLPWDEAKKHADHIREHGITQFLHVWDREKARQDNTFLWGDEVRARNHLFFCVADSGYDVFAL